MPTPGSRSIIVDDVNADGISDIVFGTSFGRRNYIMLGKDGDEFHDPIILPGGAEHTVSMSVGDFNGDGFKDIMVGNSDDNPNLLIMNNGDGSFGCRLRVL